MTRLEARCALATALRPSTGPPGMVKQDKPRMSKVAKTQHSWILAHLSGFQSVISALSDQQGIGGIHVHHRQ